MPLTKLVFKPGINREVTRYSSEGGWYDCDKVRFREGFPEKIGGWVRYTTETFLGVCRSLQMWVTLGNTRIVGLGTNLKYYLNIGGRYWDITPIRATETLTDPFSTTEGSTTVVVTDAAEGFIDGDFVTFSDATAVGGVTVDGEYQITFLTLSTYSIEVDEAAATTATGGGTVTAEYQLNIGPAFPQPFSGWGAGAWGEGAWGEGGITTENLRFWFASNFGEDLIYGPRQGEPYYWDVGTGPNSRGVPLSSLVGASDTPTKIENLIVSDVSRFVMAFGVNGLGETDLDPMLVRWSDQENAAVWTPTSLNQAGDLRLSRGSKIVAVYQSRQEILVWTDSSLYSMQFVGAPIVWGAQIIGDNISIVSQNAVAYANGIAYWMGRDTFYMYDGSVKVLPCTVRKFIFESICHDQYDQAFSGTNERFNEIWWFLCSKGSQKTDMYVVYNYLYNIWYYGTMERSAWRESGLNDYPIATNYDGVLLNHEFGIDNNSDGNPVPIPAFIESAELDIEDGDRMMFVWRALPDLRFEGSTAVSPTATMTFYPLKNSGSGIKNPTSEGGVTTKPVIGGVRVPVEKYTEQINVRFRARQVSFRIDSEDLGVQWQLGSPRIDMKPDGRS